MGALVCTSQDFVVFGDLFAKLYKIFTKLLLEHMSAPTWRVSAERDRTTHSAHETRTYDTPIAITPEESRERGKKLQKKPWSKNMLYGAI